MPGQKIAYDIHDAHKIAADADKQSQIDEAVLNDIKIAVVGLIRRKFGQITIEPLIFLPWNGSTDEVMRIREQRDEDLVDHDGDRRPYLGRTALQTHAHHRLIAVNPLLDIVDQHFVGMLHVSEIAHLKIAVGIDFDLRLSDLEPDLSVALPGRRLLQRFETQDFIIAKLTVIPSLREMVCRPAHLDTVRLGNGDHFIVLSVQDRENTGQEVLINMAV